MTRAGAGAARLRIAQGEIDGRATLRVVYPEDRINSGKRSRGSSTTLRVREDGTFGDADDEHWERPAARPARREEGRKVTIASGDGLDARADLVVRVPRGHRVAVYLAVGTVAVTNVEGELTVDTHEAEVTANGVKGELSDRRRVGLGARDADRRGPERGYRLGQRRGLPRARDRRCRSTPARAT